MYVNITIIAKNNKNDTYFSLFFCGEKIECKITWELTIDNPSKQTNNNINRVGWN